MGRSIFWIQLRCGKSCLPDSQAVQFSPRENMIISIRKVVAGLPFQSTAVETRIFSLQWTESKDPITSVTQVTDIAIRFRYNCHNSNSSTSR